MSDSPSTDSNSTALTAEEKARQRREARRAKILNRGADRLSQLTSTVTKIAKEVEKEVQADIAEVLERQQSTESVVDSADAIVSTTTTGHAEEQQNGDIDARAPAKESEKKESKEEKKEQDLKAVEKLNKVSSSGASEDSAQGTPTTLRHRHVAQSPSVPRTPDVIAANHYKPIESDETAGIHKADYLLDGGIAGPELPSLQPSLSDDKIEFLPTKRKFTINPLSMFHFLLILCFSLYCMVELSMLISAIEGEEEEVPSGLLGHFRQLSLLQYEKINSPTFIGWGMQVSSGFLLLQSITIPLHLMMDTTEDSSVPLPSSMTLVGNIWKYRAVGNLILTDIATVVVVLGLGTSIAEIL